MPCHHLCHAGGSYPATTPACAPAADRPSAFARLSLLSTGAVSTQRRSVSCSGTTNPRALTSARSASRSSTRMMAWKRLHPARDGIQIDKFPRLARKAGDRLKGPSCRWWPGQKHSLCLISIVSNAQPSRIDAHEEIHVSPDTACLQRQCSYQPSERMNFSTALGKPVAVEAARSRNRRWALSRSSPFSMATPSAARLTMDASMPMESPTLITLSNVKPRCLQQRFHRLDAVGIGAVELDVLASCRRGIPHTAARAAHRQAAAAFAQVRP